MTVPAPEPNSWTTHCVGCELKNTKVCERLGCYGTREVFIKQSPVDEVPGHRRLRANEIIRSGDVDEDGVPIARQAFGWRAHMFSVLVFRPIR